MRKETALFSHDVPSSGSPGAQPGWSKKDILHDLTGPASLISDQSKVDVYVLSLFYALVACRRDV